MTPRNPTETQLLDPGVLVYAIHLDAKARLLKLPVAPRGQIERGRLQRPHAHLRRRHLSPAGLSQELRVDKELDRFRRTSAPISAWALRPRFSFIFGLLVSASSVSSAFLPSSVDASTVTAFFVAACVSVWDEWWVWGSAPRVDPVELARCFRAGHMTVLWQAAPRQPREGAPGRRSRPLGPALSAPLPGDFRPVIVSVLEKRSRPRSSPKRASAPPRANREIRGGFGGRGSYKSTEGDPSRAPTLVLRPYSSKGCRMAKHRSGDRATSTPTSAPARGVK